MKGKSSTPAASFHFVAACSSDQYLQEQLVWYYYWQGSILLFLMITYLRVLHSGALSGGSKTDIEDAAAAFTGGNPSIEFLNNKIKIRSEDPCKRRDLLILKSWTGALLGLCSVISALFSLVKLLPAIYRSSCHLKDTWSMSQYPGATFALIESLTSLACLLLLAVAGTLTLVLAHVPTFLLRTVPRSCFRCRRRVAQCCNKDKKWKPNTFAIDHGLDALSNGSSDYDCS